MIWFLGLRIFSWEIEATDTAENGADYITPAHDLSMWRWQPPYAFGVSIIIIHEDTNYIQTVCQQCQTPPNCLPAMLNMAQLFAIIAQLLATIVKHRPTVFQFCQRLINCLPITCHFDHQIKSVKFSWFFVFLSKKCVFVFFVFHRWSAGSFAAESIGNLNMNGSNVWCMVRLYILCSDFDCIPFFLILSSDTREKVCSCEILVYYYYYYY